MEQRGIGPDDPAPDFDDGWLQVRPRDYVAAAGGVVLALPPRQLALLAELTRFPGRVRTRGELYAAVWEGEEADVTRVVDVTVAHLRARLGAVGPDRSYIHTHPRIGYRFAGEARTAAKRDQPVTRAAESVSAAVAGSSSAGPGAALGSGTAGSGSKR